MNRKNLIKELEWLSQQVSDALQWQIERDDELNEPGYWSINSTDHYGVVDHGLIGSFVVRMNDDADKPKLDPKMTANIQLAVLMRNHMGTIIDALKVADERSSN